MSIEQRTPQRKCCRQSQWVAFPSQPLERKKIAWFNDSTESGDAQRLVPMYMAWSVRVLVFLVLVYGKGCVSFSRADGVVHMSREVYQRAVRMTSAIPHPRTFARILECGGKMHMQVRYSY